MSATPTPAGRAPRATADALAGRSPAGRAEWLDRLAPDRMRALPWEWPFWTRPGQAVPPGRWRTWLVMAGRGFGKTRLGAEWVRDIARAQPGARIALVAATYGEARTVMVEGGSGLLAVHAPDERPRFDPSLRRVEWPNGAVAHLYSAAEPEGLRGPEHTHAWGDEIAKWAAGPAVWTTLSMGVRQGRSPRMLATTTPRPVPLVRQLVADPTTRVTRGATLANRAHLAADFVAEMAEHAGTRIGRQELDGELLEELDDAYWSRAALEECRHRPFGPPVRVVIGVDPAAGSTTGRAGDATGIVAVARDAAGRACVLEDASVSGRTPEGWAAAVAATAERHRADRVVAEANTGGQMVAAVLHAAHPGLPLRLVHASRAKTARAEPVSVLYERGLVRHDRPMPELEEELCGFTPAGWQGAGRSPDRAEALIWALTDLMLGPRRRPSVRVLT